VAVEETPMKNGGFTGISSALDAGGAPKFCGCLASALSAFGAAPRPGFGIAARRREAANKCMNCFANPPRTPKRYRNPRGFRKKEVKLQAALVALGKATRLKE
jgi:hypothetical protein